MASPAATALTALLLLKLGTGWIANLECPKPSLSINTKLGEKMRASPFWTLAAVSILTLAGCNNAKAPDKVDADVAKAVASAEKNDMRAEEKEARTEASVDQSLAKDVDKADSKTVGAAA